MLACNNTKKYNVFGGTNMFILGCIVAFPIAVLITLVKMNK